MHRSLIFAETHAPSPPRCRLFLKRFRSPDAGDSGSQRSRMSFSLLGKLNDCNIEHLLCKADSLSFDYTLPPRLALLSEESRLPGRRPNSRALLFFHCWSEFFHTGESSRFSLPLLGQVPFPFTQRRAPVVSAPVPCVFPFPSFSRRAPGLCCNAYWGSVLDRVFFRGPSFSLARLEGRFLLNCPAARSFGRDLFAAAPPRAALLQAADLLHAVLKKVYALFFCLPV